jgi:hypothetical protein
LQTIIDNTQSSTQMADFLIILIYFYKNIKKL